VHGLYWFVDAPDVTNFESLSAYEQANTKRYFDIITAVNPAPSCETPVMHPCRVSYWNRCGTFGPIFRSHDFLSKIVRPQSVCPRFFVRGVLLATCISPIKLAP